MPTVPETGALVISLDFELHWGVRDLVPARGSYSENLLGVRRAVPAMLRQFQEFEVSATWATVGFLFARSRDELRRFSPIVRPAYRDSALSPYDEELGEGEDDDPYHYAPSLIDAIRLTPRQELGTHTFSHYYCLEPGQTREAFRADLTSAAAIAEQQGIRLRSIVFPRNQHNAEYDDVLRSAGITCLRGNQAAWMYRRRGSAATRGARLLDCYLPVSGPCTTPWRAVIQPDGLCNVPASLFLRPHSSRLRTLDPLRLRRIAGLIERAAAAREIAHLWWHPHNFGVNVEENIAMLRAILEIFARYRESHGMQSLTMGDVADIAAAPRVDSPPSRPRPQQASPLAR